MSIVDRAEIIAALGKGAGGLSDSDLGLINLIHAPVEDLIQSFVGYKLTIGQYTEYLPATTLLPEADEFVDNYELVNGQVVPWFRQGYWERRVLQLKNLPVRQPLISVQENINAWTVPGGYWSPESTLVEGRDYYLDTAGDPGYSRTGKVIRRVGTWMAGERTVKITYQAGYTQAELSTVIPKARLATLQALVVNFNQFKAYQVDQTSRGGGVGPIQSEGLDGWNQTYGASIDRNLGFQVDLPDSVKHMLSREVNYTQYV